MEEGIKHMRRMLLQEVKIKSKLKDDISFIKIEELLIHGYQNYPDITEIKTINIQTVSQQAGNKDDGDGGIYISDSSSRYADVTNATVTITINRLNNDIIINGLGINNIIDLSVTNIEDIEIHAVNEFDVYIIKP